MIDLLSDTVTKPCVEMRALMAQAEVGDDVYAEDPTVNTLEQMSAELTGKEAALFTCSGTMSNLLAFLVQCDRGTRMLIGDQSDAWLWEARGASALAGIAYEPIRTAVNGTLPLADMKAAIVNDHDSQCAPASVIVLEDSHAGTGGAILPAAYHKDVRRFANDNGLRVHLDGARIFNAAVGSDTTVAAISAEADTVSFCLSKGLAAPIGSILAGDADTIARARRWRKMIGGGMRQVGVIAAAGLFALETAQVRLADDHRRAKVLARGLACLPDLVVENPEPQTNIIFFRLTDTERSTDAFVDALLEAGVRTAELLPGRIRAVLHSNIDDDDVTAALSIIADTVSRA